ncbi:MAG: hypothetical protein JNL03_13430 [Prolixibacteraceae bacterium]|nr:hypothetical protein [Prolixibacteraceae bacterium]
MLRTRSERSVTVPAPATGQTLKRVKSEIILGSPGMDCQGVGVCRVMAYGNPYTGKCPVVTTWLSQTEQNKIRCAFWKSTMDKRLMRRHFGWMLFQVFELYEIPADVVKTLTTEPLKIYPGIYPVWETSRFLIVDF